MTSYENLKSQVLALPLEERAALSDDLIKSFYSEINRDVDAAWREEIEERIAAMDRGEMETYLVEEVHDQLRNSLKQR